MTGIFLTLPAKRFGKCPQDPAGIKATCMFIKVIMKTTWKKSLQDWKAGRRVLIRQEICIVKNWPGCASSQKREQRKAKAGRIIFMRWKRKQNKEWKTQNCSCKQK